MKLPGSLAGPIPLAEQVGMAAAVAAVAVLSVYVYRVWRRTRPTAEELERRRRDQLVATGKMGDANVVEVRDDLLFYAYLVRGVEYTASQDVSRLKENLPPDLSFAQPVAVRYDPRNPANSIVVAEHWSGLRLSDPTRRDLRPDVPRV